MVRLLKIALIFLVIPAVLALAFVGMGTVAFVARVGADKSYSLAFQALNEAIGLKKASKNEASTSRKSGEDSAKSPRKKVYPEAVEKYDADAETKASEECLEVVDDPDRLLECIREASPASDALKNGADDLEGRDLETAYLPLFDPSSSAAMRIRDDGVRVDYLNVRFSTRNSRARVTTKVRFQKLEGPRFLVLAGNPNTEWLLDDPKPEDLTGILVLTHGEEIEGRVLGAPEGIPVWRYPVKLPFVSGIIPRCRLQENGRVRCVNGPKIRFSSASKKDRRTPFQVVDDWAQETLGQRMATLSNLSSTQHGLVVVPMEIITDTTRENLERELARAKLMQAESRVKLKRRQEYEKRWRAERYAMATSDFAERPSFNPSAMTDKAERIVVASVYETLTQERRKGRNSKVYDSYADYKARADEDVRPISIRVDVKEPIILILTSYDPVNWVFDIADLKKIAGVQLEGFNIPSFSGLPGNIPVRLRSFLMDDKSAVHYLDPRDEDTPAALDNFRAEFSGLPLSLIANYRTDAIKISGQISGNLQK